MSQPKLRFVQPLDNLLLRLEYETGEIRIFNVAPYIGGRWYGELTEEQYFRRVRVTSDGDTVEWTHGQDIAPHELYEMSLPFTMSS